MATRTSSVSRVAGLFDGDRPRRGRRRTQRVHPEAQRSGTGRGGVLRSAGQRRHRRRRRPQRQARRRPGLRSTRPGRDCRPPDWTRRSSGSKYAEDTGSVNYRYTWHLPKNRTWTYDGQLNMVRDEGRWEVRWSATGLHPNLGEHQTFALRADPPPRASVNERGGTDVLVPGYLYHYALDAKAAGGPDLMPTAVAVADALRPFDHTIDAQRPRRAGQLVGDADRSDHAAARPTTTASRPRSATGPASSSPRRPNCCPPTTTSRPRSSIEVKKSVIDELDGEAGWRVVSVNQNGAEVDVLNEVPGAPAPSVTISLDRAVQDAAQDAVNMVGRKAMIVAIKPSTGEILAVAQNAAADAGRAHRHHRALPAGIDVQDHHRGCGDRPRHGHAEHAARRAPATWTSASARSRTTAASTSAPCRCRGRSRARATPPSPNWPAGCRRRA